MNKVIRIILLLLCAAGTAEASAEYEIEGEAAVMAGAGSGDFAPFYMHSNRHGKLTQSKSAQLDLRLSDPLSLDKRFDWSWGVEFLTGYQSGATYGRWDVALGELRYDNTRHPAPIRLQQLYAEVKWRCLLLSAGLKDRGSALVDDRLSSGDLVWSGNSRSIPEVRLGFTDFQDIPLTNHWLQAFLCLSYGKFADRNWIYDHFSKERGKINPGTHWTYKRLYLRTNPTKPFHAKFGFQMSGLFGARTYEYTHGVCVGEVDNNHGFEDYIRLLLPFKNGHEGYKTGDHKGSWDISLTYRFRNSSELRAYTQFFWEDGTGMSKNNGWDGLYGLEYKIPGNGPLTGVVAEYLDFTNQSGPVNWNPPDNPNAHLPYWSRGRDDYYNNTFYRSYVNYGQTIGTPMVMGTIFQLNGRSTLLYNRVRAFHVAAEGFVTPQIGWRAKYSHRKAWGQMNTPQLLHPGVADSWSVEASWRPTTVKGLTVSAQIAADHGNLPENNVGVLIGVNYNCDFTFSKKKITIDPQ